MKEYEIFDTPEMIKKLGWNSDSIEKIVRKQISLEIYAVKNNELGRNMTGALLEWYIKDKDQKILLDCGQADNNYALELILENIKKKMKEELLKIKEQINR